MPDAEYRFLDFGETCNVAFLICLSETVNLVDYGKFELALMECGLYPALGRPVEVGEVLAVPKPFFNGTKYIRAEVLALVNSDSVKIRGIDMKHRAVVKRADLRALTPDVICLPCCTVEVELAGVRALPRKLVKRFLSAEVEVLLEEPVYLQRSGDGEKYQLVSKIFEDTDSPDDVIINDLIAADLKPCIMDRDDTIDKANKRYIKSDKIKEKASKVKTLKKKVKEEEEAIKINTKGKEINNREHAKEQSSPPTELEILHKFYEKNADKFPQLEVGTKQLMLVLNRDGNIHYQLDLVLFKLK